MNIKSINKTLIASAFTLGTIACTTTTNTQTPAQELMAVINKSVENNKIMFGRQDDPVYGHNWKYEPNRSDTYEVIEDYPAIMGWDLGGIEFGQDKNLDGVPFDVMREEIIKQDARGGFNTISWHAYNPLGGDSWTERPGVVTTILPGGEKHEEFQTWLSHVADFLGSAQDSDGNLIPFIFRPWHEHDGAWFWWGDKWATREEYRQLWDMTYDYMQARGLDNLVWCYMPMPDAEEKTPQVDRFDIVGFDTYQREDPNAYIDNMNSDMAMLEYYREKYNKPICVSETGYESVKDDKWFTEMLYPLIKDHKVSYVLLWRNAWDKPEHFYSTYKGHSSEADFQEFIGFDDIITVKGIKDLK